MDLKQLQYFLAIAEEGQITAAAQKLHMAQPPLSQQLKLLENELGVKLVERGSRHLQLTDAGRLLQTKAWQILELAGSTVKEMNDFSKGLKGTLVIGTVSSSGAELNEQIVKFHRQYFGVCFEIHEGNTFTVVDLLNKGVIEVGIVRTPFNTAGFECRYTKPEPMLAVMTGEYARGFPKTVISVTELTDKPLIVYRRFEQLLYETCLEHGFEPEFFCKNDDARTTLWWANAGLGVGIVPKSAMALISNSNLVCKEIASETLWTRIAAIWVKDRYLSTLATKFIDLFDEE